jgi:hypothetical protein
VLGHTAARRVDRGGAREQRDQGLAVVVGDLSRFFGEHRQSGLVRQQVPDGGAALPAVPVLRPDVGDALVEGEGPVGDGVEDGERRERLGDGEGHHQRVGGPGGRRVAGADDVVDHRDPVPHHGDRSTELRAGCEQPVQHGGGVGVRHEAHPTEPAFPTVVVVWT